MINTNGRMWSYPNLYKRQWDKAKVYRTGVYKGSLSASSFRSFKSVLIESGFFIATAINGPRTFGGRKNWYCCETSNAKFCGSVATLEKEGITLPLDSLFFTQDAWGRNNMGYVGLNTENNRPIQQTIYYTPSAFSDTKLFALSGQGKLLQTIKAGTQILKIVRTPKWNLSKTPTELSVCRYFELVDLFPIDSISVLFDFHTQGYGRETLKPLRRVTKSDATRIEFKIAKALRKLDNVYP